jgi:hypothetical protein
MLLAFRASLPPHELRDWHIAAYPEPRAILVEGDALRVIGVGRTSDTQMRIRGHVGCSRCARRFDIPAIGNAIAFGPEGVARTVERMKEWVLREAQQEGPCWGDVPLPREEGLWPTAD